MEIFNIIIQRTTSGLNDIFVSDNLKEIRRTIEIEEITEDERMGATKLSNQADVYKIQSTINYTVYSLIVTNIADSFGRAGFYVIRLFSLKKVPLANFEKILQEINNKYLEFERNGITKNSQDYSNILNSDLQTEVDHPKYITVPTNLDAFYLFDPNDTKLRTVFNSKAIGLFNKVYAFNKDRAVSTEIIKSLGLKSFEEAQNSFKEVVITHIRILKELKVRGIPLSFNRNESELILLLKKEDVIEYNTIEDSKFKQETSSFYVKGNTQDPLKPKKPKQDGFIKTYGIYLIMLVMIGVLGVGSWYFLLGGKDIKPDEYSTLIQDEATQPDSTKQIVKNDSEIIFYRDSAEMDNKVFKTDYPKLRKYRFRLDTKKWSYKNTPIVKEYVDFYKQTLDEIIKPDTLDFNQSKKDEFFKKLEEIGRKPVLDKPIAKSTSQKNSDKRETKTKDSKTKTNPIEGKKPEPKTEKERNGKIMGDKIK